MPYTFSQHVPWWNEIANTVIDLGGNPISGTIPLANSLVTGSTAGGLQTIVNGSFGPAPTAITASYTSQLSGLIHTITSVLVLAPDSEPIEAILFDRSFEDGFDPIQQEVFT
jgi:hypothetical protein